MSTLETTIPEDVRAVMPTGRNDNGTLTFPEGVEPYYIRTSERSNFKKCRRMWDYSSQNRMNLEPVKMNNNLSFGIAVHVGMEEFYHPENWHFPTEVKTNLAKVAFAQEIERQKSAEAEARSGLDDERKQEFSDQLTLGLGMLEGYGEWSEKYDKGITPIAVEMKYQVLIPDESGIPLIINGRPVVYQMRADVILRDEHGRLWIMDHKTAGSFSDLGFLDLDTQLSAYPWVVQGVLGERVEGTLYNELLKSVPERPKVLKKGNLSVDKRQNTTAELFLAAIRENGLDTAPYEDMLDYLRDNPREYYRRTPSPRTPEELEYQGQLILYEVRDMLIGNNGQGPSIYPNPSKINCNGCDFRAPCVVENERGDVGFILNDPSAYRQRTVSGPEED